jgi:lyso-ornithine lipid O-acyltransferase
MRSTRKLLLFVLVSIVYTAYSSLAARFVSKQDRPHFRAERQRRGSNMLLRILNLRVRVVGSPPDRAPTLIVCNHLGIFDPFILASGLPVALVAKAEVSRWPIAGWVARVMGVIFVDRVRTKKTIGFAQQVRERIDAGVPVLVFPEGTTTRGDRLLPFKTGAFAALSGSGQEMVLPMYLEVEAVEGRSATDPVVRERATWSETGESFFQRFWRQLALRSMDFVVHIGEPVAAGGRSRKEMAVLMHERVRALGEHVLAPAPQTSHP